MDLSNWFHDQLRASAAGFIWAIEQVPFERRSRRPPSPLGTWPAARHAFHLLHYEQNIALPSMRQWLGSPGPAVDRLDEAQAWALGHDLAQILRDFQAVRSEQTALVADFRPAVWQDRCQTIWGQKTLLWVVTKTYQHTAEHTHGVLSLALFWDLALGGL